MTEEPQKRASPIALLREHRLSPKKALGQNFLLDPNVCRRIADAAAAPGTVDAPIGSVLEVGPGLGALTIPLIERATHVIAIERDRDLVPILSAELAPEIDKGRLTLIEGDALSFDWTELLERGPAPRAIAGNLPYLLTGRFLERAIELATTIVRATFMVQLEVAERLLAKPGSKEYGALTVFVCAAFDVQKLLVARAGSFHPRPEVDSAVVVLTPKSTRVTETPTFRELVKGAFGMRRKTLRNAWKSTSFEPGLVDAAAEACGIDLGRRGETLGVDDFARVASWLDERR